MASFTAQLDAPDVRATAKVKRGVVDTSTAQAVTDVAEFGLEADKANRLANLSDDLNTQRTQFLDTFTDAALKPAEQEEIQKFGDKVGKLKNLRDAGLSEIQFRVRTEAILRENIAAAPGLATEFRARSNQVLGFDPTGSQLEAAFEALEDNGDKGVDVQGAILQQAKGWGMNISDFGTPDFTNRYQRMAELQQEGALIQAQASATVDQAPAFSGSIYAGVRTQINGQIQELFEGKTFQELTSSDFTGLSEEEKGSIGNQLDSLRAVTVQAMREKFPTMSVTDAEDNLSASFDYIDNVKAFLSGDVSKTQIDNSLAIQEGLLQQRALGTKAGKAASVWSKLSPNTPLPTRMSLDMQKAILDMMNGQGISEDLTKKEQAAAYDYTRRHLRALEGDFEDAPAEVKAAYEGLVNNLGTNPNQNQNILTIFADPVGGKKLAALPADDPTLEKLFNGALRYGVNSGRAASGSLDAAAVSNVSGGGLGRSKAPKQTVLQFVNIERRGGLLFASSKDVNDSRGNDIARDMQKKFMVRINTAVKAMANTTGIKTDEALDKIIQSSPGSFAWLKPEAEVNEDG